MPSVPSSMSLNRRSLLKGLFLSGGGSAAGLGYAKFIAPHWLSTERITITLPHLAPELDGLRVAQLSDLHLEPYTTTADIESAVQSVNALKPDIIALTGDFITGSNKPMGTCADILSKLVAPLGIYACLGNHDVWHDSAVVGKRLKEVGIQLLVNDCVILQHRGQPFAIAGTDSAWAGHPQLQSILAKVPKQVPLLLLAHEPDFADVAAAHDHPLLQLAGHSHGGQVRVPLWGSLITPKWGQKYVMGHYTVGSSQLYVNRGIGCVGVPLRFACAPEITEITLHSPLA